MGHSARVGVFLAGLVAANGCATCPEKIRAGLKQSVPERSAEVARAYTIACPDVVEVRVERRPECSGTFAVEPDGCLAIPLAGRVRVDGASTGDVEELLRRQFGTSGVTVTVARHASRHLLVFGPGDGVQRVVPYVGPESVTDLFRRTGGLAPEVAFHAVNVVRPHVADGRRPEVFNVDLDAIVARNDTQSDVRLEPYDQVYLGETRGASVARCLPPWLRAALPGMSAIDAAPKMSND